VFFLGRGYECGSPSSNSVTVAQPGLNREINNDKSCARWIAQGAARPTGSGRGGRHDKVAGRGRVAAGDGDHAPQARQVATPVLLCHDDETSTLISSQVKPRTKQGTMTRR
jgi:hypothetical protein